MTEAGGQTRLVLEDGVMLEHVIEVAAAAGWTLVLDVEREHDRRREVAWWGPWPGVAVHYVDDHLLDVRFMLITGADREAAVEDVRFLLPAHGVERLVLDALPATTPAAKIAAIRRIAAATASASAHEGALWVFEACFADDDAAVRKAAIFATTYPGWRQFDDRLRALAHHDRDPDVRALAARTHDALVTNVWSVGAPPGA
jgi:hypothetical protein